MTQTLTQAKEELIADVHRHLTLNIKDVAKNNYRIRDVTKLGRNREMFADYLCGKIANCYMPITFDEMIEWAKEEPMLIERLISPCFYNEESGVLAIIRSNIHNYLKQYAYQFVREWTKVARAEAEEQ